MGCTQSHAVVPAAGTGGTGTTSSRSVQTHAATGATKQGFLRHNGESDRTVKTADKKTSSATFSASDNAVEAVSTKPTADQQKAEQQT